MKQAAVFILLGQSNATGHAIPMAEEDKILQPMKNVFGLSREHNQSLDLQALTWSGYTSGGMNLGENQDHTYSVANCLARQWQDAVDGGADLPDLYIIHIAIGAQGVTEQYMWYPDREPKLIPGVLWEADISLHPFTRQILSLVPESFRQLGKEPRYCLHWRGGEEDTSVPSTQLPGVLPDIYRRMFADYYQALGQVFPIVLHEVVCKEREMEMDPTGEGLKSMYVVDEIFRELAKEPGISLFDVRTFPGYDPDTRQHNLFIEDAVHFTPEVNAWVAGEILKTFQE